MGKKSREKKERHRTTATLEQHQRAGSRLVPPLLDPKLPTGTISWANDRLPEVLWAALLVIDLGRMRALERFRAVADFIYGSSESQRPRDITHSGIAGLSDDRAKALINVIGEDARAKQALAPLLLLSELPSYAAWQEAIGHNSKPTWEPLMAAVAGVFDHQSQEATDVRWLKVLAELVSGRLHFATGNPEDQERINEILKYPSRGDMRSVRPMIRAMEMVTPKVDAVTGWPQQFWRYAFEHTPCFRFEEIPTSPPEPPLPTKEAVVAIYAELEVHARRTSSTSAVNPKHEILFGTALFALATVLELIDAKLGHRVVGRIGLRTLAEAYINVAYLCKKDDPSLWESFRAYGAGQAKLTFLKFEDVATPPNSIDLEMLRALANEDMWQEFVPIELGHWEKSNLRKMSEEAVVKDVYDAYYQWPSHYAHAHWAAIRDTTFTNCANPLHRFHRIPRDTPRPLPNVMEDAVRLVDRILAVVESHYPDFPRRLDSSESSSP